MLTKCRYVVGDIIVKTEDLRAERLQNVVGVPQSVAQDDDNRWGLYTSGGVLIEDAAYKRGPGRRLVGQSDAITFDAQALTFVPGKYIYGGAVHRHYGHHLLSVLPRYWWLLQHTPRFSAKIAIHTFQINIEDWLAINFVSDTLGSFGLKADDFVAISRECYFEEIIVPEPAFVEQSSVSEMFKPLLDRICRLNVTKDSVRSDPLFLSKASVVSGVSQIVNEKEFVDELGSLGVRVVEPERLTFRDQVALLSEHNVVSGILGSALHTLLFVDGKRVVALAQNETVPSNFLMVDRLRNHDSKYVFPTGSMENLGPTGCFQVTWRISDPVALAKQFAALLFNSASS